MLILTRKIGECITIGDQIRVYVIDIRGRQVRLGIEAPPEAMVHREEVYRKIVEENRRAAQVQMNDLEGIMERNRKE